MNTAPFRKLGIGTVAALLFGFLPSLQAQTVARTTFYFPQIAAGQNGDGTQYLTFIGLTNPSVATASGVLKFKNSDGSAMPVNALNIVTGEAASGTIAFTLPPSTTSVWQLSTPQALMSGWAIASTEAAEGGNGTAIGGTGAFRLVDAVGTVISSAGVGAVTAASQFFAVTTNGQGNRTGIAVASPVANTITFTLMDSFGNIQFVAQKTLPLFGHYAAFVEELFPGFGVSENLRIGTLKMTGTSPLTAVAVQYSGSQLTTLPVISN